MRADTPDDWPDRNSAPVPIRRTDTRTKRKSKSSEEDRHPGTQETRTLPTKQVNQRCMKNCSANADKDSPAFRGAFWRTGRETSLSTTRTEASERDEDDLARDASGKSLRRPPAPQFLCSNLITMLVGRVHLGPGCAARQCCSACRLRRNANAHQAVNPGGGERAAGR